jgi:hypothetical protein
LYSIFRDCSPLRWRAISLHGVNKLWVGSLAALALLVLPGLAEAATVKVYLTRGEQLVAANRTVPEASVEAAVSALLKGPTTAERKKGYGTALPMGVTMTSAEVDDEKVTLNLSDNFAAPDARYLARVAQAVYTVVAAGDEEVEEVEIRGRTFTRDDFKMPEDYTAAKLPKPTAAAPKDVRGVQEALEKLGYLAENAVTGKWDNRTQQAVLAFQAWEGLERDGIPGSATRARLDDAGRPKPQEDEEGKYVEIYRDRGVVLLVADGRVERAVHTSTGIGQNSTDLGTPAGTFTIQRKAQRGWSIPYKLWQPYAVTWNGGFALYGAADVPAAPSSFGGARVPLTEARNVWGFVDVGTPVRVI